MLDIGEFGSKQEEQEVERGEGKAQQRSALRRGETGRAGDEAAQLVRSTG